MKQKAWPNQAEMFVLKMRKGRKLEVQISLERNAHSKLGEKRALVKKETKDSIYLQSSSFPEFRIRKSLKV